MQDRFKFRAYDVKSFFDDDDNEYEKTFHLDDVCVDKYCDCGIYYDDVVEQLKKQGFTNEEIEVIVDSFDNNDDWLVFTPVLLVQCTGLKDKNGKLIFEDDILKLDCNREDKGVLFHQNAQVIYELKKDNIGGGGVSGFSLKLEDGTTTCFWKESKMEIIGNIYENPELLGGAA